MEIRSQSKDQEMVQMMIKNPPLEQTGGPREEGQERNLLPPVLQVKRLPRQQERLPVQDLRLARNLLAGPADQEFETGVQDEQAEEEVQHLSDWFQKPTRLPSPDHAWNTSVPAVHEFVQPWLSNLAQQDPRESFDELTDSTFDFSAFVLNRLNVQTLTPELPFSLRNIRVNSFTMKMEILLESTSNKLMILRNMLSEYDESNTYVLERFNTTAGNPVKKILLKLNLSDHRLFKDGGGGS
ncbi:hypothetical protein Tco_0341566 [Tanacetum coccineum]